METLYDPEVFRMFVKPGEVVEVRVLGVWGKSPAWGNGYAKKTVSGYFDDHKHFCDCVRMADKGFHAGIYFTLQVIDPRLLCRALNRLIPTDVTTSDNNVLAYRWLPIDIDPVRPSGVSASNTELAEALSVRDQIGRWLIEEYGAGFCLRACSGNGGHVLMQIPDTPVTEESKTLVKAFIERVASRFDTDRVKIDRSVFNPGRIWKLYGTTARKGDPVPAGPYREARPHRQSFLEFRGEQHDNPVVTNHSEQTWH